MLEGKDGDILDPLDWCRQGISGKAFADQDLDAPGVIARVPVVLIQKLSPKGRELQRLELAGFGTSWKGEIR